MWNMNHQADAVVELDSGTLVRIASEAGYQVTARMLETFRGQSLLPRPARAGYRGRAPVWTYPVGAEQQLLALLGWREHTKDSRTLRVLLWLDGFPVPPGTVRESLVDGMQAMLALLEREIAARAGQHGLDLQQATDRTQALRLLSGEFAAKRGPSSLPRRGRVRAADRARAVELILRMFVLGDRTDVTTEDATTVERVLGVAPNGRRHHVYDAGPWLTGPAEALFDAVDVVAFPNLLHAVHTASNAELNTARRLVIALFRWLPLMARLMAVLFDDDNYAGMSGLQHLDEHPDIVMIMVPWVVGRLRAGWQDNLQAIATALDAMPELVAQTEQILDMPDNAIKANLSGAPAHVRETVQRIIDAAIDGTLRPGLGFHAYQANPPEA